MEPAAADYLQMSAVMLQVSCGWRSRVGCGLWGRGAGWTAIAGLQEHSGLLGYARGAGNGRAGRAGGWEVQQQAAGLCHRLIGACRCSRWWGRELPGMGWDVRDSSARLACRLCSTQRPWCPAGTPPCFLIVCSGTPAGTPLATITSARWVGNALRPLLSPHELIFWCPLMPARPSCGPALRPAWRPVQGYLPGLPLLCCTFQMKARQPPNAGYRRGRCSNAAAHAGGRGVGGWRRVEGLAGWAACARGGSDAAAPRGCGQQRLRAGSGDAGGGAGAGAGAGQGGGRGAWPGGAQCTRSPKHAIPKPWPLALGFGSTSAALLS